MLFAAPTTFDKWFSRKLMSIVSFAVSFLERSNIEDGKSEWKSQGHYSGIFIGWYTRNLLLITQIYNGAYLCNQTQKSTEYHIYVTFKEFPKTRMSPEIKKLKSAGVSVICLGHFKENEISSPH